MTEYDGRAGALMTLCRMLAYVREEALRLQIMDVATLLEHAEDAATAFGPGILAERSRHVSTRDATRIEH